MSVQQFKPMYSVEELANELRVSKVTMWRQINAGKLSIVKIGSRVLIKGTEAERYVNELEEIKGVEDE